MSFTSVVVGRASFKKISETAKVKSFGFLLQISKFDDSATNECKVLCSFISVFMYSADSLFASRPFAWPKFKKSSNFFSEAITDTPKLLFSNVTFSLYIFHSANNDTNRRPLVFLVLRKIFQYFLFENIFLKLSGEENFSQ